eukprot:4914955-Alexandrium_andersonii.AAC.1
MHMLCENKCNTRGRCNDERVIRSSMKTLGPKTPVSAVGIHGGLDENGKRGHPGCGDHNGCGQKWWVR